MPSGSGASEPRRPFARKSRGDRGGDAVGPVASSGTPQLIGWIGAGLARRPVGLPSSGSASRPFGARFAELKVGRGERSKAGECCLLPGRPPQSSLAPLPPSAFSRPFCTE